MRLCVLFGMALACLPSLASAEEKAKEKAPLQAIEIPPSKEKARIDAKAKEIKAMADAAGKELFVELPGLMRTDKAKATKEITTRLSVADKAKGLVPQIDKLTKGLQFSQGDPKKVLGRTPRYEEKKPAPSDSKDAAQTKPAAKENTKWWEKLVFRATQGVGKGLTELAEKRGKSLQSKAEALASSTDPKYRAYAEKQAREAVEDSSLGKQVAKLPDKELKFQEQKQALGKAYAKGKVEKSTSQLKLVDLPELKIEASGDKKSDALIQIDLRLGEDSK